MQPGLYTSSNGTTATLFSANADRVDLCVFADDLVTETHRLSLQPNKTGWWSGTFQGLPDCFAYGYRVDGPYAPEQGHRFNANKLLIDPYAKVLRGKLIHDSALYGFTDTETGAGFSELDSAGFVPKGWFDPMSKPAPHWQRPATRWRDTIVYEAHLKGHSKQHEATPAALRGTYAAWHDGKLAADLADLGVSAVEFLPLMTLGDERHLPPLGLTNYWGYNPINFFMPTDRYASGEDPVNEVQTMVRALHAQGLEVVLDVVFNHSAEGDHLGPTLSFRGIDNASYFHLDPANQAHYLNPTGTGNALNASAPVVQRLVLDALIHWHEVLGMDGFRFDLAATLARGVGASMRDPRQEDSLTARIAAEPRLASAKLIAEPWDIGTDGYQLGRFGARWAEWNDRFRDRARALWHPEHQKGALRAFADSLLGSASNFDTPLNSLNFISAHDGFTLADLVSFNHRHNERNAEDNRDGHGHNLSWNHGEEGPTDNSEIQAERLKTSKALLLTLLLAQGVPMITMGDERGRTQQGNNNAYCQDNPLSWMDWSADDEGLRDFVKEALAVLLQHPLLRQPKHLHTTDKVEWRSIEGRILSPQDWEDEALTALFLHLKPKLENAPGLIIAINIGVQDAELRLPAGQWSLSLASDGTATRVLLPSRCIALYVAV